MKLIRLCIVISVLMALSSCSSFYAHHHHEPQEAGSDSSAMVRSVEPMRDGFESPLAFRDKQRQRTLSVPVAKQVSKSGSGIIVLNKRNVAETHVSNYHEILATKESVAKQTLIFGSDSFVLDSQNKKVLIEMMQIFNPATDVVSVLGCSTGKTDIPNGNAALAIGRANRVKEALLYSGIPHNRILDEGCWSSTSDSTPYPNRGVVITVKREIY